MSDENTTLKDTKPTVVSGDLLSRLSLSDREYKKLLLYSSQYMFRLKGERPTKINRYQSNGIDILHDAIVKLADGVLKCNSKQSSYEKLKSYIRNNRYGYHKDNGIRPLRDRNDQKHRETYIFPEDFSGNIEAQHRNLTSVKETPESIALENETIERHINSLAPIFKNPQSNEFKILSSILYSDDVTDQDIANRFYISRDMARRIRIKIRALIIDLDEA